MGDLSKKELRELIDTLYPFNYSITGEGNDNAAEVLKSILDFEIYSWSSGLEMNGWVIPNSTTVKNAKIEKDGKLIYDGTLSPLRLPSLCPSFKGSLSLDKLQNHIFSQPNLPDSVPTHWSNLYRPKKEWGFCMPHNLRKNLKQGSYDITIETEERPWEMKVLIFTLPGKSKETIILNAHNCHPFQANDDVSGMAVGISLMKKLAAKTDRFYTYCLLIAPELHGPMFWLNSLDDDKVSDIKSVILFKSVGNSSDLKLQRSFDEDSLVCKVADHVFSRRYEQYDAGPFRSIYGNDETVFEALPYRIPSISLTRWPFKEYHTDFDTPDRISTDHLHDTLLTAEEICDTLEMTRHFEPKFRGLVCLSKYDLYLQPSISSDGSLDSHSPQGRLFRLMNSLPSLLGEDYDILKISEEFDLPVRQIYDYLMRWEAAGLLEKK